MGVCASKPWEIDLRNICQRLHCFFACCESQIIFHTSELDGSEPEFEIQDVKEIYDPHLVWPYSLLVCGQPDAERLPGS